MFDPSPQPRCFGIPVGADFFKVFLDGLRQRLVKAPPEAMAQVQVFVNSRRAARRLQALFLDGPATFLPRISVIDALATDPLADALLPAPVSPLYRRVELARIIAALLDADPSLAPRSAIFDLADSLANLMDEMHGEGVSADAFERLDISNHAAHWERSLTFLRILAPFFNDAEQPDHDARQRLVIEYLVGKWAKSPPRHPVLVAGSTGSRGATALLMRAVAELPQGAVILPGFDLHTPCATLLNEAGEITAPDHPQAGLWHFMRTLGSGDTDCSQWCAGTAANSTRNRLVSLALRPAPVTDHWLKEGPRLDGLDHACRDISLIEAPSQRLESLAIALRLRKAAEDGQRATLISPDRQLTRLVTAALARWNILPDDSAGRPLALTPPGVFLRLTAGVRGRGISTDALLALLKHPLTHSAGGRNEHLLRSRDLELRLLRGGPPRIDFQAIQTWGAQRSKDTGAVRWAVWLEDTLGQTAAGPDGRAPLADHVNAHLALAEALAKGPDPDGDSALWQEAAGNEAQRIITELQSAASAGGGVTAEEYESLLQGVLGTADVRDSVLRHGLISIWGPREARLLGDDLVILAGLNEGVWPRIPAPDPWLNRAMRRDAGLLLPERQIGLSAHDFQMALGAKTVILSRALRDSEAPTVASRWLIRLTNLLSGIGAGGAQALSDMRARGAALVDLARAFERPRMDLAPALRPAPRPPLEMRPARLSVTQIKTLIRDPYTIYARNILRLRPLEALHMVPDALVRGRAVHAVMEAFVSAVEKDHQVDPARLLAIAAKIFETEAPWPATRRLWLARMTRIADWIAKGEQTRQMHATPVALERSGEITLPDGLFTLTCKADRIDRTPDGQAIIYDYKTGKPPSKAQITHFDKQLPLEGAMAVRGAFRDLPPMPVAQLFYIGLGSTPESRAVDIAEGQIEAAWQGLQRLIAAYRRPETGYVARARMEKRTDPSDYDHLSRRGEWDDSDAPIARDVP